MTALLNFPLISQKDGSPNELWNCVPACLVAGIQWLTGKVVRPGDLLREAYPGVDHRGGTDAEQFVAICMRYGVHLFSIRNTNALALVNQIHQEVNSGHPVLLTIPDPYSTEPGVLHVLCAYNSFLGGLEALDPMIPKSVSNPDTVWASLLQESEIWIMSTLGESIQPREMVLWHTINPSVVYHPSWAIPATWLAALRAGRYYGPPLSNETAVDRNGVECHEQAFTAGYASWNPETGITTWSGPNGLEAE